MQDDSGLITIYLQVGTGLRSTRVKLPGDCQLVDAEFGGLSQARRYPNAGPDLRNAGKPQVKLTFRLVEAYDQIVERLFRVVRPEHVADMGLIAGQGRCLGTIATVGLADGETAYEVIEMQRHDVGVRVSDIKTMLMVRGLNRLAFIDHEVVRVNGCEVATRQAMLRQDGLYYADGTGGQLIGGKRRHKQAGAQPLQWELRYQQRRKLKGMVGWSFIGTSADESAGIVPASLTADGHWKELRAGLYIWLSENLRSIAND